jgi:hypothetical protein
LIPREAKRSAASCDTCDVLDGPIRQEGDFRCGIEDGERPEGFGRIRNQFGECFRAGDPDRDGHPDKLFDVVADDFRGLL